jgi:signal transduction histidine kinase
MSNPVRNARRRAGLLIALLAALAVLPTRARADADLSPYVYEDTKQLVAMVNAAAALMAEKGAAAFAEFEVRGSRWRHGEYYLFVYAVDGTCVFHPEEPTFVGKNLIDLRDSDGRPVTRDITRVARRPEPNASGWVFYMWENRRQLSPTWKAAYIRKVVAPDNKVYAIGSGISNPKTERIFVKNNVDRAVRLLSQEGKAALEQLRNSEYAPLETYIFVMDARGKALFDPVFPTLGPRDLWDFTDSTGALVIQNVLERLASQDEVWMTYLEPQPGSRNPSRKLMYVRKAIVDGETLFVGSDFFLAIPIWMRAENDRPWQHDPPT